MAGGITLILLIIQLGGYLVSTQNAVITSGKLYTVDKTKCFNLLGQVASDLNACQDLNVKTSADGDDHFIIEKTGSSVSIALTANTDVSYSGTLPSVQISDGSNKLQYGDASLPTILTDDNSGFLLKLQDDTSPTSCLKTTSTHSTTDCDTNVDRFVFVLDCSSIGSCLTCGLSSSLPDIICSSCSGDLYPNSLGDTCSGCDTLMPGCTTCTAADVCTACDNGKTAASKCQDCENGQVDKDGVCVGCETEMPGCTTCTAADVCTACDNDRTAASKCQDCENGQVEKDGECVEAETGEQDGAASFAAQFNSVVLIAIGLLLLL